MTEEQIAAAVAYANAACAVEDRYNEQGRVARAIDVCETGAETARLKRELRALQNDLAAWSARNAAEAVWRAVRPGVYA